MRGVESACRPSCRSRSARAAASARSCSNRASCSAFSGCSGSSAQAKCVMTKSSVERVEQVLALRERGDVGGAQAEPVHARVDVQQRAAPPAPTLDLLERAQDGPCLELDERVRGARERAFEDADLGVGRQRAQLARFGERRDEEPPAAFAQQAARDALDAEAVGIGFDDGGALAGLRALAQQPVVARQRIEIDAQRRRPRRRAWSPSVDIRRQSHSDDSAGASSATTRYAPTADRNECRLAALERAELAAAAALQADAARERMQAVRRRRRHVDREARQSARGARAGSTRSRRSGARRAARASARR